MLSCWTTNRLGTHQGRKKRTNKPHALSKTAHRTTSVRSCRRHEWNPSHYAMNQVAKTNLATKKIHRTPASLQHVKNTHRTRSTNNCSPRNGRNTIAIHNTIKKTRSRLHFTCGRWKPHSARTPSPRPRQIHLATTQTKKIHRQTHRVCKCASLQRNMTVKHNLYTTRAVSGAVGTQRQRPQLRMDGEQFWWTPTVPPATPPSQDASQWTRESRSVREDFHTLPQSV